MCSQHALRQVVGLEAPPPPDVSQMIRNLHLFLAVTDGPAVTMATRLLRNGQTPVTMATAAGEERRGPGG